MDDRWVRLAAISLLGILGYFALEATRQIQVTKRFVALQKTVEAGLRVRADSLAHLRSLEPPRKRYRFHPDGK